MFATRGLAPCATPTRGSEQSSTAAAPTFTRGLAPCATPTLPLRGGRMILFAGALPLRDPSIRSGQSPTAADATLPPPLGLGRNFADQNHQNLRHPTEVLSITPSRLRPRRMPMANVGTGVKYRFLPFHRSGGGARGGGSVPFVYNRMEHGVWTSLPHQSLYRSPMPARASRTGATSPKASGQNNLANLHPIVRPSLAAPRSRNPHRSSATAPVSLGRIGEIWPNAGRKLSK